MLYLKLACPLRFRKREPYRSSIWGDRQVYGRFSPTDLYANSLSQPPRHDERAPLLQLQNLTVRYGETTAIHALDLQVNLGDHVAVVGPNGVGKSTLFNVIAGIIKPPRAVRIGGSGQAHICVGYVPQRNRIDWRFPVTVADVVMMGRVGQIGLLRWPVSTTVRL